MVMGRRGRKRRLELEAEYWRLILSGVGLVEACRTVGISRKTGYRWQAENGGLPPARVADLVRLDGTLSLRERRRIDVLWEQGASMREIARRLGRSASTISREIRRNVSPSTGGYDGDLAHARAQDRARQLREGSRSGDEQPARR